MKATTRILVIAIAVVGLTTCAFAQADGLQGTVYLRGGDSFSGNIKVAEMGVMDGSGIGTDLANNGAIAVKTASGSVQRVPADNIATLEATWKEVEEGGRTQWQITELTVTKRDGTQITGTPDWFMHATSVAVEQADGEVARVHAYPLSKDFSPENLLKKIELAEAPAQPQPTTEEPEDAKPEPEPTTEKPQTEKPEPEPTDEKAQTEKPEPEAPETSIEITPQPGGAEGEHAPEISDIHVMPSQDVVITLSCPNCGETITLLLRVSALQGLASGASGVKVAPVQPVE
ncbi:MAG: hypothetical protein R6V19_05330 [Armatimonadota bacterium]